MIWKGWFTPRAGKCHCPTFPKVTEEQVGITWIGHASFLCQFSDLNLLIDPNFGNWLFFMKRLKRAGCRIKDLPHIDLVLITHAHYDHFHRKSIKQLASSSRIGIVPWGMGDLAKGLGFERIVELQWWETFSYRDWKVTLTPGKHWGARNIHDEHRGYGGYYIEHQGRHIYHAGDSAYSDCFKEIGRRLTPEIAMLPIGAYYPDSFRHVHMGPDEAIKVFKDIKAKTFIPMHYGSFKLSFEALDEPPRWLQELAHLEGISDKIRLLEEGVPEIF
jgi:L-ascorbate metabolism protein UlaG (beta-lactamase superfamily)